jgi:hypothetical protein
MQGASRGSCACLVTRSLLTAAQRYFALEILRGSPFAPPPFLRRNKAHAGAESFVIARGLAGVLEGRMVPGPVPARAPLSRKLSRSPHCAATQSDRRSCVSQFLTVHGSSLLFTPGAAFTRGGLVPLSLASARANNKVPHALREAQIARPAYRDESSVV